MQLNAEPRIEVIDGEKVLVFDEPSILPPSLDRLLQRLIVTFRDDFTLGGMSSMCALRSHRLRRFREGRWLGPDGLVRELAIRMCEDCGAVCVRDVSFDSLQRTFGRDARRQSTLPLRRRNEILGWYTGARKNNREYR